MLQDYDNNLEYIIPFPFDRIQRFRDALRRNSTRKEASCYLYARESCVIPVPPESHPLVCDPGNRPSYRGHGQMPHRPIFWYTSLKPYNICSPVEQCWTSVSPTLLQSWPSIFWCSKGRCLILWISTREHPSCPLMLWWFSLTRRGPSQTGLPIPLMGR